MKREISPFGEWLKREMIKRNMNQTELAEMLGFSRARVSFLMRTKYPQTETIAKVYKAFGLADSYVWNEKIVTDVEYSRRVNDALLKIMKIIGEIITEVNQP